jgi:hypothetical protein
MRYTFSDDEEDSDDFPSRKSTRNSGISTPAEPAGPTVTASGRQVKSRHGGMYGETMLMDQRKELENERAAITAHDSTPDPETTTSGRPQRSTRPSRITRAPRRIDDSLSEDLHGPDSDADKAASGHDWSGHDDNDNDNDDDEDEDDNDVYVHDSEMEDAPALPLPSTEHESLVVQLRYRKGPELSPGGSRSSSSNGIPHAGSAAAAAAAAADCIAVDPGPPLLPQRPPRALDSDSAANGEQATRVNGGAPEQVAAAAAKLEAGRVQAPSLLRNSVRVMSFQ